MTNKNNIEEARGELVVITEQVSLEPTKVETLLKNYAGSFAEAKALATEARSINVTSEDQTELMQTARTKRLELRKIRIDVENMRVQLKEQSLREGKAIDGMANIIKALIIPVEEHLEKQEKYAENLKLERAERLNTERVAKLAQYTEDPSIYNVRDMSDAAFENLLNVCKTAWEAKKAAEAKAEADRKAAEEAEKKRIEKIEKENERLRKQKEAQEKKLAAERKAQQEKLEKERKAREQAEAKLKAEKEAKEKAEREAKEKAEAEKKAKEEAERQALLAPDKDKLITFAGEIEKLNAPNVASREAGRVLSEAIEELTRISNQIRERAKSL